MIVLAAIGLFVHQDASKSALEKYKAELRAKGELLTLAELTASFTADVPDSMGVITNAAAKLRTASFQPGGNGVMEFIAPGNARVTWMQNAVSLYGATTNYIAWTNFLTQLDQVEDSLEKIREAMKNPAPHMGPRTNYLLGSPRPDFVRIRSAAQWLTASAVGSLHRGNLEATTQDIEALAGLARLNREELTLVSAMIRVAIAGLGEAATWEALQARGWSDPQLERLQKAWASVDLLQALENGFVGERAFGPEIFGMLRRSDYQSFNKTFAIGASGASGNTIQSLATERLLIPAYKMTSIDGDELFHLTKMNEVVEQIRMMKAGRPWKEVKADHDKSTAAFEKQAGSQLWSYRHWISVTGIPNFSRATQIAVRRETQRQMTVAAIALKRYELRYGKPPPNLEALVPEFLSELPNDCMSGKPLRYRFNANGTFTLYSVGEDRKDDGGDPTPVKPGDGPDLWSGHDAVWPSASTNEPAH